MCKCASEQVSVYHILILGSGFAILPFLFCSAVDEENEDFGDCDKDGATRVDSCVVGGITAGRRGI